MKKIDLSNWKSFVVGEIFTDIITPPVYHTREVTQDSDGIPYVVRSKFNNGIKYRVKKDELILNPAGVISYGAENSQFFYQDEEYVSGRDMYYIDTRNLSKDTCLFICSCLNTLVYKYSYNYGLFPKLLKKEKVFLPAKNDQPDWDYMAAFIKNKTLEQKQFIEDLSKINTKKTYLDVSSWGSFKISLLFPSVTRGTRLVKAQRKKGDIPLATAGYQNEGIADFISNEEQQVFRNSITIDMFCNSFYRDYDFCCDDNIIVIDNFNHNKYVGMFLASVISASGQEFSYDGQYRLNSYYRHIIKLPINKDGDPDWDYMEDFMKKRMKEAKEHIEKIKTIHY